jgi:hypothetical protein
MPTSSCLSIPTFPSLVQYQSYDLTPKIVRSPGWSVKKTPTFSNEKQQVVTGKVYVIKQRTNPLWNFELTYQYLKDNPADNNPFFVTGDVPATDLEVLESFYCDMQGQGNEFAYQPPDFVRGGIFSIVSVTAPSNNIAIIELATSSLPFRLGDGIYVSSSSTYLNGESGTIIGRDSLLNTITVSILTGGTFSKVADSGTLVGGQVLGTPDSSNNVELVNTVGGYPNPLISSPTFYPVVESVQLICIADLLVWANGVIQTDFTLANPNTVAPYQGYVLQFSSPPASPLIASYEYFYTCRFSEDTQDYENFMAMLWACSAVKIEQVPV